MLKSRDDMVLTPRPFDITRFFLGRTRAIGVLESRFGRLKKRFLCEMEGRLDGETFVLDEVFTHDDGTIDRRQWRFERTGPGRLRGHTSGLVGAATGVTDGPEFRMRYVLSVMVKGRPMALSFEDRLYALTDSRAINRATMRKFGVRVGELTFHFERIA